MDAILKADLDRTYFREVEIRAAGGNELGEREFEFIASDETPDSYGDIVRAEGWDLKRYKKNPIILHNSPSGAIERVIVEGPHTPDMTGTASTSEVGAAVAEAIRAQSKIAA